MQITSHAANYTFMYVLDYSYASNRFFWRFLGCTLCYAALLNVSVKTQNRLYLKREFYIFIMIKKSF